jgi:hypothetical protein
VIHARDFHVHFVVRGLGRCVGGAGSLVWV